MLPPPLLLPLLLLLLDFGPQEHHSFHLCTHFFQAAHIFRTKNNDFNRPHICLFFFLHSYVLCMATGGMPFNMWYCDMCIVHVTWPFGRARAPAPVLLRSQTASTATLTSHAIVISSKQIFLFCLWISVRANKIYKNENSLFGWHVMARYDDERAT